MPVEPISITTIKQERNTAGHFSWVPLVLVVPAGATRYQDIVVPDLTDGWDWLCARYFAGDADSGDEVVTGKSLAGAVGQVASDALAGATTITLIAPLGVLRPTQDGGALSEGWFLAFGIEASSAAEINAIAGGPPGTGTLVNPEGELREYEIKRIGAEGSGGPGLGLVTVTLFVPLAGDVLAGTPANLVVRAIPSPIPITKGATYTIGETLVAGPLPAGAKIRFGYRDIRASGGDKVVRATLDVMFG